MSPVTSSEVHERYRKASDRAFKRFEKTGRPAQSIITKLRRLENLLYWYRLTVDTSPPVIDLLNNIPLDIQHYQEKARLRGDEKTDIVGWGVKMTLVDGTSRWYTNEKHDLNDAQMIAGSYNKSQKTDPVSGQRVRYTVEPIRKGDKY